MDFKILKKEDARLFLDGPEVCREYVATDKITFGTSTLLPGQTGAVDPGHPESHEIFFVSRGHVIIRDPSTNQCVELLEEQALLVPEGVPHELTNIGTKVALVTWSCAPKQLG